MTLEEERLTCMVCREGYGYKPDEPLCAYVFQRRVGLPPLARVSGEGESGIATVTAFHCIHLQCHTDATRSGRLAGRLDGRCIFRPSFFHLGVRRLCGAR